MDAAIVVDNASTRCPPVSARDNREFSRWVSKPPKDRPDGWSEAAFKKYVDRYKAAQWRKNKAGKRLIREYKKCRRAA